MIKFILTKTSSYLAFSPYLFYLLFMWKLVAKQNLSEKTFDYKVVEMKMSLIHLSFSKILTVVRKRKGLRFSFNYESLEP